LGAERCRVSPPEPPVAIPVSPERRAAVKGALLFGAAQRTLGGEHCSGMDMRFTSSQRNPHYCESAAGRSILTG